MYCTPCILAAQEIYKREVFYCLYFLIKCNKDCTSKNFAPGRRGYSVFQVMERDKGHLSSENFFWVRKFVALPFERFW